MLNFWGVEEEDAEEERAAQGCDRHVTACPACGRPAERGSERMAWATEQAIDALKGAGGALKVNELARRLGKKRGATAMLMSRAADRGRVRNCGAGLYTVVNP